MTSLTLQNLAAQGEDQQRMLEALVEAGSTRWHLREVGVWERYWGPKETADS